MTVFEFVFGPSSIIISLALTHLLAGSVALRTAERVRFSIPHALWVWSAFVLAVGNWASTWELRLMNAWPSWTVLLLIVVALSQYILCAFVTPESRSETTIDLAALH